MELRKLYSSYQSSSASCNKYFETMKNKRDVISHCGGFIGNHPFLLDKFLKAEDPGNPKNSTENNTAKVKTTTEEANMATELLSVLNQSRYGVLQNELHNAFCMGRDK